MARAPIGHEVPRTPISGVFGTSNTELRGDVQSHGPALTCDTAEVHFGKMGYAGNLRVTLSDTVRTIRTCTSATARSAECGVGDVHIYLSFGLAQLVASIGCRSNLNL